MFYKWPNVPFESLQSDKAERVKAIAVGLGEAEIEEIRRRFVTLKLPNLDEAVEGDVTQTGITVYLGGFDWVTFPTPPQVLQKFPEFLPLPQQVFRDEPL